MRHVLFSLLMVVSVFKCTGARAEGCLQLETTLVSIAETDPDAFDMENLEETGTFKYMCLRDGKFDSENFKVSSHPWSRACIAALARGCL
jgi:hypothetical protein